jgi:hypothetical protein
MMVVRTAIKINVMKSASRKIVIFVGFLVWKMIYWLFTFVIVVSHVHDLDASYDFIYTFRQRTMC